jgi:N-acetylglucosamine kinase-like BadF-type ATPase
MSGLTRLFLGVDGGQSSTTAVIGDEHGRILGSGTAGPCYEVADAVGGCLAAACQGAGLDPQRVHFAAACFGFSGGPDDRRAIVEELAPSDKLVLTTDAAVALTGATAGEPGIITIAGTGSIAFGRNAAARTARAGGWGYIFGDEGGAFDLVRQALRASLRHAEGWGPHTTLIEKLMEATGTASANHLLHLLYTADFPRDRIASYAPLIEQAAIEGDETARRILEDAARQLAGITAAVRRQLFEEGESAIVTYSGGAFRCATLRDRFRALVEIEPGTQFGPPLYEPAVGALIEAYRADNLNPKPVLRSHF